MLSRRSIQRFAALWRLHPMNLLRVGQYRATMGAGLHPVQRISYKLTERSVFRQPPTQDDLAEPNYSWNSDLWWFGWYREQLKQNPPDWFDNPFRATPLSSSGLPWWKISDFGQGDIKGVWELSRFNWVVALATQAVHGNAQAFDRLSLWLEDWAKSNPPYNGPNWKCGQEASIRVMHLCVAAWVLGQDTRPEPGLVQLIACHMQRIAPTMSYAIGQQNNHGTSEAAALFIGGSLLEGCHTRAGAWSRKGRRWLEERALTLIEPDGSFSQYSVTYHRLMLDSYSLVEAWRRHRKLPPFSSRLRERLSAASIWLQAMTDSETGDAPNMGANDGAWLIPLTNTGYRDFRPSVQLASALFRGKCPYGEGVWNEALRWLEVRTDARTEPTQSMTFNHGGYHVLREGGAMAVLRYPRFRFRPSQADALHLDLWHGGRNLLRDAGTYSYNDPSADWFGGTSAHNTVEFDGRDQMPRLGRFLFGDWLSAQDVETVHATQEGLAAGAGYTDQHGARHHRRVVLGDRQMTVTDSISGRFDRACLRWRLEPGEYSLGPSVVRGNGLSLNITADDCSPLLELSRAPESRYYQQKDDVPVLEVTLDKPTRIKTTVYY